MWVIKDRLTKSAHFLAVRRTFTLENFCRLYIREIIRLHGAPLLIRKHLLTAQSRQNSYANRRQRPLEFDVSDHVFLKVMPKRGGIRFGKRGKLSSRYIGPFEVLEKVGTVAYQLALPLGLSSVHAVFHVSMLRKYTPDLTHVVD